MTCYNLCKAEPHPLRHYSQSFSSRPLVPGIIYCSPDIPHIYNVTIMFESARECQIDEVSS